MALMQAAQLQISLKSLELCDRMAVVMSPDFPSRREGASGKDMDALSARMAGTRQESGADE